MGPVAADAGAVTTLKESAGGHDWLRGGMTSYARAERVRGRGVLVLVTGRAYRLRGLVERGVLRGDLIVAGDAWPRLGGGILVGPVAAHALTRAVDRDRGDRALRCRVAAHAVGGLELGMGKPKRSRTRTARTKRGETPW